MKTDKNESTPKNSLSKKELRKIINIAIPVFLLIIIAFSVYNLIRIQLSYKEADTEYDTLTEEYAKEDQDTGETVIIQPGVTESSKDAGEDNDGIQTDYPSMHINYEALTDINEDFRAWIRIPVLNISYPIVRADDNSHYLNYTFEGKWNAAGCLFIDYENSDDFSDYNTYIYGHNMKNGSMFGSLKRFRSEPE